MNTPAGQAIEVEVLREGLNDLRRHILHHRRLVLLALLIASLLAPLASITNDPVSSRRTTDQLTLFAGLRYFTATDGRQFGSTTAPPFGLNFALVMTRVGLIVLVVAIFGAIITLLIVRPGRARAARTFLAGAGGALILSAALTALALWWIPADDASAGPTAWLMLPLMTGIGLLYHVGTIRKLE